MKLLPHKFQQLHILLCNSATGHTLQRSGSCNSVCLVQKMDLNVSIHLTFLFVVNIIFTLSGIILNTLVIISFWRSSQLRKKLCHFLIMVLSCFDLISVITNYPGMLLYLISWLMEDYDLLPMLVTNYLSIFSAFLVFSFHALLVMSIERYLGAYYPIFHRTSVTRRRLLTLLAILLMFTIVMFAIFRGSLVIYSILNDIILVALFFPPFIFVNFKLFIIARKVRRERAVSPEKRKRKNLKNISTALWVVGCLMLFYTPTSINIAFNLAEKSLSTIRLSYVWMFTCITMNCTLNSLIFFWKNKVLRTEGIKILKTLKDRLVGS